jgi:hypothetical protein
MIETEVEISSSFRSDTNVNSSLKSVPNVELPVNILNVMLIYC